MTLQSRTSPFGGKTGQVARVTRRGRKSGLPRQAVPPRCPGKALIGECPAGNEVSDSRPLLSLWGIDAQPGK